MSHSSYKLGDFWQHRGLIWQFIIRNIELRHKGSHLGFFWSLVNPLLLLGLYVFVFGFVFGGSFGVIPNETRLDYGLGVFVGLTVFHFISELVGVAPLIITGNPNFVKKVVFPLEILPVAAVGASAFHALVTLTLALVCVAFAGLGVSATWLWLTAILFPILLMGLGGAWLLSAIGAFFRDLGQLTQFLSMALLFSSAVFYPSSKIPGQIWTFLRFNPIIHAVESTRDVIVWQINPSIPSLIYLNACGLVIFTVGFLTFRGLSNAFADVL